jgi:DNA-binding protein Fis
MDDSNRYTANIDQDSEPGSNKQVLKNYLGIISKEEVEDLEERKLKRTEIGLLKIFDENHQFSGQDIGDIHELWLGDIHPSAGKS